MPLIWSKILCKPKTTTGNLSRQSRLSEFPIQMGNFFRTWGALLPSNMFLVLFRFPLLNDFIGSSVDGGHQKQ